jgi:hypothetical protein
MKGLNAHKQMATSSFGCTSHDLNNFEVRSNFHLNLCKDQELPTLPCLLSIICVNQFCATIRKIVARCFVRYLFFCLGFRELGSYISQ